MLAALFGTSSMMPLAAPAPVATAWQEGLVTAGFASVGLAMIAATALVLWGLRAKAEVRDYALAPVPPGRKAASPPDYDPSSPG